MLALLALARSADAAPPPTPVAPSSALAAAPVPPRAQALPPPAPAAPAPVAPATPNGSAPASAPPATPAGAAVPAASAPLSAPPAGAPPGAPLTPNTPAAAPPTPIYIEPPPPPVPAPDPTVYRHDGFYLRMGLGAGVVAAGVDSPIGKLNASGRGVALDFALGGTVADGLVIGGGLFISGLSTVHWKGDALRTFNANGSNRLNSSTGSLVLIGVVIDYYPDPKQGFHVQGGLGIGGLTFEQDTEAGLPGEEWSGGGGGAMLGVGYEAWVGSQWSLGAVMRVLVMSGTLRGEHSSENIDARGIAPALLFVATHH